VAAKLAASGIRLRVLAEEWAEVECENLPDDLTPRTVDGLPGCATAPRWCSSSAGDGTLLRAAEMARPVGVPLLGVNLGRVGFLAEAEQESLDEALDAIIDGTYAVEERMTIDAVARLNGDVLARSWALNEVALEKGSRERILEVVLEVDGARSPRSAATACSARPRPAPPHTPSPPAARWSGRRSRRCCWCRATRTRCSPGRWWSPPNSQVAIEVDPTGPTALLDCDGRRTLELPAGARVELTRGAVPVRMVRLDGQPFADRLVRKFDLPVRGWRGAPYGG
jgi:NAD+ kinase